MTVVPIPEFDPHPLARGGALAICSVSAMHLVQAGLWLWSPSSGHATNMRAFLIFLETVGIETWVASWVLVVTALLALTGTLLRLGSIRLPLFLPQHLILAVMTLGGLYASYLGHYLDGTVMEWEHILTDQLPLAALFVVHSGAILRRASEPNG